ncbi:MAG TPA: hypothetical protein VK581_09125 [Chthoniobacterales bacterium]|nr:hypothetical protein [Chthoniobacterales bacterium]
MPRAISFVRLVVAAVAGFSDSATGADTLRNPTQLVPPIRLTRAESYMDGGSLGGTLTDARGRNLDFFFYRGLSESPFGNLLIGFRSGHPDVSMKPTFDGWKREDLFLIIEQTIRRQFIWDATAKTLKPASVADPASKAFAEDVPFARNAVKHILRYVESALARKTSYVPLPEKT